MNKRIFLSLFALIFLCGQATACLWSAFEPQKYWAYRVCPMTVDGIHKKNDNRRLNNLLWQEQTSDRIPLGEIDDVVYSWSRADLENFTPSKKGAKKMKILYRDQGETVWEKVDQSDNDFAKWIFKHDKEAVEFLLFAKRVEELRSEMTSPWYYPYEGDELSTAMNEAVKQAREHLEGRYHDRYMLQLVRLLLSLKRHEDLINLWAVESIKSPLMRKMIAPYVAGAYYARHDYEQALQLYGEGGDVTSIMWCLEAMGKSDPIAIVDYMATMPSVCNCMLEHLQKEVLDMEHRLEINAPDDFRRVDRLIDMAHKRAEYAPKELKAVWYYTEAYGYWLKNNPYQSYVLVQKAEKYPAQEYLAESIHILRLLNESRILPLGDRYIEWLYDASRYLIGKAKIHKEELKRESVDEWIAELRDMNFSCEYYTDMLRKITIGYAAPRLLEIGGTLRALQITDMADYTLIQTITPSHRSHSFGLADSMRTSKLEQFVQRMENPQDKYDRFFNSEGSCYNKDYWYDLLGTKMLRERRYQEAVRYLSKVSPQYNQSMQVAKYCDRNPFAMEFISDQFCHTPEVIQPLDDQYKLHFAQRMVELSHYTTEKDPDVRATMELEYAVGMRNSFYPCWALTQYYWGEFWAYHDRIGNDVEWKEFEEKIIPRHAKQFTPLCARSEQLMNEALATFRNKELLAQAQWSLGRYKTVARRYADTDFARKKRGQCDRWDMYVQGDEASADSANSR